MIKRRGARGLMALVTCLAIVAAACGGSDDASGTGTSAGGSAGTANGGTAGGDCNLEGTVVVSNWGNPADQDVYAAAADRFEAAHPCVTVKDNFTPITTWSDYVNKLVTDVAAGNAPDVINIAIEGVQQGAANDLFLPLEPYLKDDPSAQEFLADVDPQLIEGVSVDGTQYLMPSAWNSMMIWYNAKMFEEAGIPRPPDDWTWDDFLEIATKLTTGEGADKVYGFAVPTFNFGLTPWYYSNGTSEVDPGMDGSNLDDPKMAEAAQFVSDLINVHGVAPAVEGTDPYQLFPAGKVAMTGAGRWLVGPFNEAGFTDGDILPWPRNTERATVFGVSGYGIYKEAANPDLAWEYIGELVSEETLGEFNTLGASVQSRRSLADTPEFKAFPTSSGEFYGSLEYGSPVAAPANFSELEAIMNRAMGEVLAGSATATDAFAGAHEELEQSFADLN
jgi:multiple sugar transport system substrate-binding protein